MEGCCMKLLAKLCIISSLIIANNTFAREATFDERVQSIERQIEMESQYRPSAREIFLENMAQGQAMINMARKREIEWHRAREERYKTRLARMTPAERRKLKAEQEANRKAAEEAERKEAMQVKEAMKMIESQATYSGNLENAISRNLVSLQKADIGKVIVVDLVSDKSGKVHLAGCRTKDSALCSSVTEAIKQADIPTQPLYPRVRLELSNITLITEIQRDEYKHSIFPFITAIAGKITDFQVASLIKAEASGNGSEYVSQLLQSQYNYGL